MQLMPRILPPTEASIAEAARVLRAGGVVAMPTETVYGLAANTFSIQAIERVYLMKGRPAHNPLIAHVLNVEQAERLSRGWDARCAALTSAFWPGPLTIILLRDELVPPAAAGGLRTVALRSPAHPVARELLARFGGPLSAPSANRSGGVSPTSAQHVADDFADEDELIILDGGACEVGIESTVLDMSRSVPQVLRPGAVSMDLLRDILGAVELVHSEAQAASPGTSPRHYAPRTQCEVIAAAHLAARLREQTIPSAVLCFEAQCVTPPHKAIIMPRDSAAYAARLYDALRAADASGLTRILIVKPEGTDALWTAILDRISRACAPHR